MAKFSSRLAFLSKSGDLLAFMSILSKRRWIGNSLSIVGIGLILAVVFKVGNDYYTEQKNPYRYPFQTAPSGKAIAELQNEISFLRQRIKNAPNDGLDRANLAQAYLKMARATGNAQWYLLAEQSAKRSYSNLPFNNSGAILALARVSEAKHDFSTSIRMSDRVLKENSQNEDALSILVTSNLAIGKLKEAELYADKLVAKIASLNTLSLRALVKTARGKDLQAIADFQAAIALEEAGETGNSAKVRTQLGRLYFQRGELSQARELYDRALAILPRYPFALISLAELETRQGNYQAAEDNYARVFISAAYPETFDHLAWYGRAQVKELQGDRATAKTYWQKAKSLLDRHSSLNEFGHRREAAKLLLSTGTDLPQALNEALKLMEAELKVRRDAETLDTYAWALTRSQRWQEAQNILEEAFNLGTRNAAMFYRAGKIAEVLGNQSKAIAYFQKAQTTDPTFNIQAQKISGIVPF